MTILVVAGAPAAAADDLTADVALEHYSTEVTVAKIDPGSGQFKGDTGIGFVTVNLIVHNYGPNNTGLYTPIVRDVMAPPGTVFRHLDEQYFAEHAGLCTVVVPHSRVRCKLDGSIWLDTYNGGSGGHMITMYFVLKKKCVSPGWVRYEYPNDPRTSNNAVSISFVVPGVTASECTTHKPSPAKSVAASPTPAASVSPTSPPTSIAAIDPSPTDNLVLAPPVKHVADSSPVDGVIIGIVGALAGAALVATLVVNARRRRG